MANYASSITEISKQNNYLYPDFSNTGYFKTFEPRQQKARPHLRLVDEGSTEISRALARSTTSTFDDSTSLDGIDIDGTKGDKIATNQKPDYSETTNRDRVTLLAKKYAQKYFSKEDEARLAIVTERIRLLMPRVTMDDFEQLAEIAGEIKRINELDNKLRNELGL
jgi:hypothetical protein